MELEFEVEHLRSQLKFQHNAYSKLQKEKEQLLKVQY